MVVGNQVACLGNWGGTSIRPPLSLCCIHAGFGVPDVVRSRGFDCARLTDTQSVTLVPAESGLTPHVIRFILSLCAHFSRLVLAGMKKEMPLNRCSVEPGINPTGGVLYRRTFSLFPAEGARIGIGQTSARHSKNVMDYNCE